MIAVIQRVSRARVTINGQASASINKGFLVLLGVEQGDTQTDADYLAAKICAMRIMGDADGKMNLDMKAVNGELLVVSQFTLMADTRKGNRPSFIRSAQPQLAKELYEYFVTVCEKLLEKPVPTGTFAADMQVELVNDGPVTITINSREK